MSHVHSTLQWGSQLMNPDVPISDSGLLLTSQPSSSEAVPGRGCRAGEGVERTIAPTLHPSHNSDSHLNSKQLLLLLSLAPSRVPAAFFSLTPHRPGDGSLVYTCPLLQMQQLPRKVLFPSRVSSGLEWSNYSHRVAEEGSRVPRQGGTSRIYLPLGAQGPSSGHKG